MTMQTLAAAHAAPSTASCPTRRAGRRVATFLAVVAYGVILYSLSFRYLTLFPQERDLRGR